jgi:putative chitinase
MSRPAQPQVNHVSLQQLRAVFQKIDATYVPHLNETMAKYAITTKLRKANFLAQVGHECAKFMRFEENLNYSAQGLHTVFGKYFPTLASAQPYHRQPQKIANYVYANRMGNGSPATGDGWNYRGRGAIQLTGKNNYMAFATDMRMSLPEAVTFLSTPRGAILSAGWFWNRAVLNPLADAGNLRETTRRINGGYNGMEDRQALYNALLRVL